MYLPSCTYPSKSDFGSITSPFVTENNTAVLDHSTASEYRGYRHHEPRQQYPAPPWKWTLHQANRAITSAPGEAGYPEYQGLSSPSETLFNPSKDCFLYGGAAYGASGTRFYAGDARSFPGRYTAFNPDSQLLFPAGRNRVLPPAFNQFFEFAEEGVNQRADITPGREQQKETNRAEWTSCHTGESSEVRAGSESPQAGKEDEEDAPLSSGSGGDYRQAQSESKPDNKLLWFKLENVI